ncbi:hypothetical protein HPCPY6261_0057 [Helicobacter pylori CPY6261]|nr:hypothetical protein HPCPY6261_0057 [Helicobacter pylori CPY6261]
MYRGIINKLVAFIPNAKDVWDFCLGGFKKILVFSECGFK